MPSARRKELESLGLKVPDGTAMPGGGDPLVSFEVDEDHPNWLALRSLFQQWEASDFATTIFSKQEISQARWLELVPDWHHGYPQPDEKNFGYRGVTYEISDYCKTCGIGLKQKAPFRMKGEPKWGRNGVLQLNWVFDEYFATPEVWNTVFKPHGIVCSPVLNLEGKELNTVVQVVAKEQVGVTTETLRSEKCVQCGRVKYLPVQQGPFPTLGGEPEGEMAVTKEYFGSGSAAHKRTIISGKLADGLIKAKGRGISFRPVGGR